MNSLPQVYEHETNTWRDLTDAVQTIPELLGLAGMGSGMLGKTGMKAITGVMGDVIDVGGRRLEILFTPGHAPDSICLIDRENRQLFTGDTFYLAPLYSHIPGSSFPDYAKTAARLAGLADDIDTAITSHNVPVVDGSYMTALGQAFAAIEAGNAIDVTVSDGNREYHFEGFSVIVRD